MNKNINKILIMLLIIITLLITGCILPVKAELIDNLVSSSSGFTMLSMTPISPISNNDDIKNATIRMEVVSGGGEKVVGIFGNESFSKFVTNLLIKYPLQIEMGNLEEFITYSIINQGETIYEYKFHEIYPHDIFGAKCDGSTYCFPAHDENRLGFGYDKIIAINKKAVGKIAVYGNADKSWKGKIFLTINGIKYEKEIGSNIQSSVNFYDIFGTFVANAKWLGDVITGLSSPNQDNYIATYKYNNDKWNVASEIYRTNYLSTLSEIDTTFKIWKNSNYIKFENDGQTDICENSACSNVLLYITNHNKNVNDLLNQNEQISYNSILTNMTVQNKFTIVKGLENSVTYKLPPGIKLGNSIIVFTVSAKKLSLYIPTSELKIESIISQTFNSGSGSGLANIKIKNIGNAKGTYAAILTENTGIFSAKSNTKATEITLNPGEIGTISMNINYGTNLENINRTGLITVYDVNYPSDKSSVSKDFIINMNSPKLCKANEFRFDGVEIYQCNNDGSKEELKLVCNDGLIVYNNENNKYECNIINGSTNLQNNENYENVIIKPPSNEKLEEKEELPEKKEDGIILTIIYWLISFLVLTGIFTIITKIRNKDEKITKKNIDNSMIMSGIILGLTYLWLQYIILSETLGIMLWTIITVIFIIVIAINIISYIKLQKFLTKKESVIIFIILFMIITIFATTMKDMMCSNWITSWLFNNCEKFDLWNYLF